MSQGPCVCATDGLVARGFRVLPPVDVSVHGQPHFVQVEAVDIISPKVEQLREGDVPAAPHQPLSIQSLRPARRWCSAARDSRTEFKEQSAIVLLLQDPCDFFVSEALGNVFHVLAVVQPLRHGLGFGKLVVPKARLPDVNALGDGFVAPEPCGAILEKSIF